MNLQIGQTALSQPGNFQPEATSFAVGPFPPDISTVAEGFADHLRRLLRTPLVSILFAESTSVTLQAIATESAQLADMVRGNYRRDGLHFAADLVRRAALAGETVSVTIDPVTHGLGEAIPSGMLLAAPFRTSLAHGAIVVYPRSEGPFSKQEKSFLFAVCGFLAVAIANAELCASAQRQLRDLRQRLEVPEHNERATEIPEWNDAIDAISDFILSHDERDQVSQVNRSLADFIGVQPAELVGVAVSALFPLGSTAPGLLCPLCQTALNSPSKGNLIAVLERSYLVSTARVHAGSRARLETVHVLKDVTDWQDAERRYRELFDNIQEGIFFAVPDGRFIEVNDALVQILGYASREDLLHLDIRTAVWPSTEDYEQFIGLMRQRGSVHNYEQTLRRADGTFVHVLVNAFAVSDIRQNIVQYRGAIQDINVLKTSQSELHRERDFSAKILDNTQSLILVANANGEVTYANRRWYEMGYQHHQLLGRPLQELIAASRRQALARSFVSTLNGEQTDNLELQIVRGEGRVGHFSANLSPMRDEQGKVVSVVVVMSDITDAATLQSKLMHAEKMAAVGQLVSGVAHEVNNPLTAILGFADLLMENPEMPDSARKDLRVILQEAQRTKQIVQNLLSVARQTPPQRAPTQLNTIVRRTVQLRAYDLHSRGVEVVERLEKNLHQVMGDSHQLQQVFLNILNNAYDAVRDIGRPARIEIRTTNHDKLVEVVFRDNGKGIEFPERIFDPFFTTKEIGKGTGLGLSICYGIVREHGGEIFCQNNTDEEGATFIVRLPAIFELASVGASAGVAP